MKSSKKLAMLITALTMCSSAAVIAACDKTEPGNEHTEHSYTWTQTTPPTCTEAGEETGVCECGETDTRPVDPTGHDYGEWEMTLPGHNNPGTAQAVCKNDSEHVISATLPALSNVSEYKSVTASGDGPFLVYTYVKDGEEISFTAGSVSKAVQLAEANMNKVTDGTVAFDKKLGNHEANVTYLEYEYGDNYLYLHDDRNLTTYDYAVTMFIDRMVGEGGKVSYFFPMVTGEDSDVVLNGERSLVFDLEEMFNKGIPYSLDYADHPLTKGVTFYGAGELIKTLYNIGVADDNGDFTESAVKDSDGTYTYNFSYGYKGENYFHVYNVSFKLDADNVLVSATVSNTGYTSQIYDDMTNAYIPTNYFYTDEEGHTRLNAGATALYTQIIRINHNQLTAEDERHPNPYKYEDFVIQSFNVVDVTNNNRPLTQGATINMTATNPVELKLVNLTPTSYNVNFDSIRLYLVNDDNTLEECGFMYDIDDYHLKAHYNNDSQTITLNPHLTGIHRFLIRTENITYSFTLNIATIAPAMGSLKPSVYSYNDVTEEATWRAINTHKLYAGQPLRFKTDVLHPAYEEKGYTVKVTDADGNEVNGVVTEGYADGVAVSIFKTDVVGEYTVTLTSIKSSMATVTLNVIVTEAPSVSDILSGEYTNDDNETTVTFTPSSDGATSGSATIVMGTDESAVTTTVGYTFNANNNSIALTYVDGADDYDYSLELTEAYRLVLSYVNSRGVSKRMMILRDGEIIDTISDTYELTVGATALLLYCSTTGVYTLTTNLTAAQLGNGMAGVYPCYAIYEGNSEEPIDDVITSITSSEPINIAIKEGQSIKVWTMMAVSNRTFTLKYEGPFIEASEVTFDKTEAEMEVGGETLTITATVGPEDVYDKTLTWSSSDEDIATVDENGVVTAKFSGTVTITATTVNGKTATCTITVTMVHVTGISLEQTEITVEHGVRTLITPVIGPEDASVKTFTVSFESEYTLGYQFTNDYTGVYLDPDGEGTAIVKFTTVDGNHSVVLTVTVTMTHVESVALDKTEAEVYVGSTMALTPVFNPENASDKSGTWTSSDTGVATVNYNGTVTGVSLGTATITFTTKDGEKTASCVVTVKYTPLEEGENGPFSGSRFAYKMYEFHGEPDTAYVFKVKNLSDYMIYEVKADGTEIANQAGYPAQITSDGNGIVRIDFFSMANSSNIIITVGKSMPVESVAFESETVELYLDQARTFDLVFTPSAEHILSMSGTWTSSDTSIVSVSSGTVTPKGLGTATITFTLTGDNTKIATRTVTVKAREISSGDSLEVTAGKKYAFTLKGEANASYIIGASGIDYYAFSTISGTPVATNKDGIFSADADGNIRFILQPSASGTVTITAEKGVALEGVSFETVTADLYVGETLTLTPVFNPENALDKTGVWTSSNTAVATVDDSGKVEAVGEGRVTITFTANAGGFTATCEINSTYRTLAIGRNGGENIGYNDPLIYLLAVLDGETYTISDLDNAYFEISCSALNYNNRADEGPIVLSQAGEYIIKFYSNNDNSDESPAYFTLSKTGEATPTEQLTVGDNPVTVGEKGLLITLSEAGDYTLSTADNSLYFITKTEEGYSVTVVGYEEGVTIKAVIPEGVEATSVTASINVAAATVYKALDLTKAGNYTVEAAYERGPVYKIEVVGKENWSITSPDGTAFIVVSKNYNSATGIVENDDTLNIAKLKAGTYYIQILSNVEGDEMVECHFTVTIKEEITVGANEIAVGIPKTFSNGRLEKTLSLVGGEAGKSYTVTFTNEGTSAETYIVQLNNNDTWAVSAFGAGSETLTITVTADANGKLRILVYGDKVQNATLTVEEA